MEHSLLSIIVPTHDNEQTLARCLNSILNQEYSDFEVILVDDGSTDQTPAICARYANRDKRIKYYGRESQGVSATRNFAVSHACGELIMFVDGDDYVSRTFCKDAIQNQQQYNSDIVEFGYTRLQEDGDRNIFFAFDMPSGPLTREQLMAKLMVDSYLWNKLYRKSLFDDVRFPINHSYEDSAVLYKLCEKAQRISFLHKSNYTYVYSKGSITANYSPDNIRDQFKAAINLMDFLQDKYPSAYDENRVELLKFSVRYLVYCTLNSDVKLTKRADFVLRKLVNVSDLPIKYKIIVTLYRTWPFLTTKILRVKQLLK